MQLIAYLSMFIDHICKFMIKGFVYIPLTGRFAMPIFAYLIATGMKRTKVDLNIFLDYFCLHFFTNTVYINGIW